MIPIDLSGKVALVTGVANDLSFAWYIAKALQAAGARLIFSCHPRMIRMVEAALTSERPEEVKHRELPFGAGSLKPESVLPCDVSYDTLADVPQEVRTDRRYQKIEEQYGDYSIQGMFEKLRQSHGAVDILIHSIAFSPEIKNKLADTARKAYLQALSISSYSLTALLKGAQALMENRPE